MQSSDKTSPDKFSNYIQLNRSDDVVDRTGLDC